VRHYADCIPGDGWFTPVRDMVVPWPCAALPDRTIDLSVKDILTKDETTGKWMKHTGLGCFNIVLRDDQVKPLTQKVSLSMTNLSELCGEAK